ncbi:hypothetical protein [Candidatus Poriferisodalis sp.]
MAAASLEQRIGNALTGRVQVSLVGVREFRPDDLVRRTAAVCG